MKNDAARSRCHDPRAIRFEDLMPPADVKGGTGRKRLLFGTLEGQAAARKKISKTAKTN